jgi:hypothetical protein
VQVEYSCRYPVLRVRDVYPDPGSGIFPSWSPHMDFSIPDLDFSIPDLSFSIPDLDSGSSILN